MIATTIRCLFYYDPQLMAHFVVAECPECGRLGEYDLGGQPFMDCATCTAYAVPDRAGDPPGLCVTSDRVKRSWARRGPVLCAVLRGYAAREATDPDGVRDTVLGTLGAASRQHVAVFELANLRQGRIETRFISGVELAAFTFADCSLPLNSSDPAAAIMPSVTATYDALPALAPGPVSDRLAACGGCAQHQRGLCSYNKFLVAPRAFWPGEPWPRQSCPRELWPDSAAVTRAAVR